MCVQQAFGIFKWSWKEKMYHCKTWLILYPHVLCYTIFVELKKKDGFDGRWIKKVF